MRKIMINAIVCNLNLPTDHLQPKPLQIAECFGEPGTAIDQVIEIDTVSFVVVAHLRVEDRVYLGVRPK